MAVRVVLCALGAAGLLAACTSGTAEPSPSGTSTSAAVSAPAPTTSASTTPHPSATHRIASKPKPKLKPSRPATPTSTARSTPTSATSTAQAAQLPLSYPTDGADQVLTVVAAASSDTQATLQAWRRSGTGWRRVGPAVPAWLGSAGMTTHPSEQLSATPIGSFSLTEAFGHNANPGSKLPYTQTTPADWWISQAGPLYNTMQRCSSDCAFTRGDPNEHLYDETPFYNYAVVIDYNRQPVQQGAGSAFFLHVTVGAPTAGCVSIDQAQLMRIMQWLAPSKHPRILIGTV